MQPDEARRHAEALYREYHPTVRDYLNRMCRNIHLADDLASETFERALRSMSRPGAPAHDNPAAWLRAIARNLLTDHYRRAASRRETASAEPIENGFDPLVRLHPTALGADCSVLDAEAEREAQALLAPLTSGQREVMRLRTLDGYDTCETAAMMGRSHQAVRSLRHKALRRLQQTAGPAPTARPAAPPVTPHAPEEPAR